MYSTRSIVSICLMVQLKQIVPCQDIFHVSIILTIHVLANSQNMLVNFFDLFSIIMHCIPKEAFKLIKLKWECAVPSLFPTPRSTVVVSATAGLIYSLNMPPNVYHLTSIQFQCFQEGSQTPSSSTTVGFTAVTFHPAVIKAWMSLWVDSW